jgi:hypothetical protein
MRRECLAINPPIDGVASDAEMLRNIVYRVPTVVQVQILRLLFEVEERQP